MAHRQSVLEHNIRKLSLVTEDKSYCGDCNDAARGRLEVMRADEDRWKYVAIGTVKKRANTHTFTGGKQASKYTQANGTDQVAARSVCCKKNPSGRPPGRPSSSVIAAVGAATVAVTSPST